jgi:hypothetical protein
MDSPVRSARAFAWRIKTSPAISSTLRSSCTVFSSSRQLPYGNSESATMQTGIPAAWLEGDYAPP